MVIVFAVQKGGAGKSTSALSTLDPALVSNLPAAKANAKSFAGEVVAMLKQQEAA